jgi:hypothetical protein
MQTSAALCDLSYAGRCDPQTKTRAALGQIKRPKGMASGNLQLRHVLFRTGGLAWSGKPCGGRDCGRAKMQLVFDSAPAAIRGVVGSQRSLARGNSNRFGLNCSSH